tara:strand:+ start:440 stop:673 length:234 start_codon:yes stop_codon:yes gene_type:complete
MLGIKCRIKVDNVSIITHKFFEKVIANLFSKEVAHLGTIKVTLHRNENVQYISECFHFLKEIFFLKIKNGLHFGKKI